MCTVSKKSHYFKQRYNRHNFGSFSFEPPYTIKHGCRWLEDNGVRIVSEHVALRTLKRPIIGN